MSEGISLLVGLGNPGLKYHQTRHNAGAWLLQALCEDYREELRPEAKFFGASGRITVAGQDLRLLFPATYMNKSGQAVAAITQYFKIPPSAVLVAYDELDLPPGTVRLKTGGGHGGHNGVRDVINALGSRDFHRLRIGIGHPGAADKVLNYVLGEPSRQDAEAIGAGIRQALDQLPLLCEGRFQIAMNRLHARSQPEAGAGPKAAKNKSTGQRQSDKQQDNDDGI